MFTKSLNNLELNSNNSKYNDLFYSDKSMDELITMAKNYALKISSAFTDDYHEREEYISVAMEALMVSLKDSIRLQKKVEVIIYNKIKSMICDEKSQMFSGSIKFNRKVYSFATKLKKALENENPHTHIDHIMFPESFEEIIELCHRNDINIPMSKRTNAVKFSYDGLKSVYDILCANRNKNIDIGNEDEDDYLNLGGNYLEDDLEKNDTIQRVREVLDQKNADGTKLKKREQNIIYGNLMGLRLSDMGRIEGVSPQALDNVKKKALEKIKANACNK